MNPARAYGFAAVIVFLALPLALIALTGANLMQYQANADVSAREDALLAQLDARLARLDVAGRTVTDMSSIYVKAAAAPLAAADLQQLLSSAATDAGGKVIETQVVDRTDETTPADEIVVRLALDVNNAGLLTFLQHVETGLPLMFVEALSVRQVPGTGDAGAETDPTLRVDCTVRAAWKAP
ncbi:type II secretion system protein GspM [Oryzibacter oryziterrae]|uniref:type II secretion system protein GspM n=1 Tax=Oryzibacter oryziterrae TaxID=2766474 RepID=UPI001F476D6D|nr:type II secretion system protein GspM [Oryzibacter oryziterrae]